MDLGLTDDVLFWGVGEGIKKRPRYEDAFIKACNYLKNSCNYFTNFFPSTIYIPLGSRALLVPT